MGALEIDVMRYATVLVGYCKALANVFLLFPSVAVSRIIVMHEDSERTECDA